MITLGKYLIKKALTIKPWKKVISKIFGKFLPSKWNTFTINKSLIFCIGKKATKSGNETHQHDDSSDLDNDVESNVTNADIVSNGWSLQKESEPICTQELEDCDQLTKGT